MRAMVLEALDMGRYAWFVWPAYGAVGVVLTAVWVSARLRHRRIRHQLLRRGRRDAATA